MPTALPLRAQRTLQLVSASLIAGAMLAIFATASYGHAGHAHVTYGPPAPDSLWPGAPAARDAINQASFQEELAQAPVEVDGSCEATASFDGLGTGCRTEDGMLRLAGSDGNDLITHGPDFVDAASDLTPSTTTPSIVAAVQNATKADVSCVPATEAHTQLIYAIPADGVDRSASKVAPFRQSVYEASAVIDNTSRMLSPTAGRRLRVACDGSNDATVMTMRLPRRATSLNFNIARQDIEAEYAKTSGVGNATKVRYLVYYDAHLDDFAGVGSLYSDTTASATNNNNRSEGMALQDNSTDDGPDWFVLLHEIAHNMGAVQDGAPDSNEVSHCNDGLDVMCYPEPGTMGVFGTYTETTCVELQFDCDHDSYFHPAPTTPWLQANWNVAATYNRYLHPYAAPADTTAPSTPTGLVGTGHGTFIRLTWNAVADSDLHTYRIERDTGGGVWRSVGDAWFGETTYDAKWTGFAASTSYNLRIRAYDKRGNLSAASSSIAVNSSTAGAQTFTVGGPALAAPINAVVESSTSSTITLRWEAPQTSGATGWELDKEHAGGWIRAQWGFGSGSGTITLNTISTGGALSPATRYQYRIRLTDDWGRASSSITVAGWTKTAADVTAPAAPGSLVVASSSGTSPRLTWATAVDAVDYVVSLESSPGSGVWNQQAVVTSPTYTFSGLAHGTSHSIAVQARDEAGNASTRSPVTFVAPSAPSTQAPTAPTISGASFSITHTSIGYSWSASTDDGAVTYRMLYTPDASPADWLSGPTTTGLSGTITGLKPGTLYRVSVEAMDADGRSTLYNNGGYFLPTTTADTTAPTQPGLMTATGQTETSMQLNWGASTDSGGSGVVGYRVYRTTPGPSTLLTTTAPGTLTYTPTGLTANTTYTFEVEAFDHGDNVSTRRSVTSSTTAPSDPVAPTTPATFTSGALTESTAEVSWTAATDNVAVTGYRIYRMAPAPSNTLVSSPAAVTSSTLTGLTAATSYTFEIAARDAAGNESAVRRSLSFTTPDQTAPTAPGNFRSSGTTATGTTLAWDAATDNVGVTQYRVERVSPSPTVLTTTTALSFAVSGLSEATAYQFRVFARDAAGNESFSTIGVTTLDVTAPVAPTSFTNGTLTETSAPVSWSGASDNVAVTGYRIYRITAGPTSTLVASPAAGASSTTLSSLTVNTAYTFEIAAIDAAGLESTPRRSLSFTTPDLTAPAAPGNFRSSGTTGTASNLAWEASTDNVAVTQYRVERVSPDPVVLTTTTGLSYGATGLSQTTTYRFRVFARDAAGNESSSTIDVTTPDVSAPDAPTSFTDDALTETTASVSWSGASDNVAVTGYRIYRMSPAPSGALVASPGAGASTATLSSLAAGTTYTFEIAAIDAAGLESSPRRSLSFTTPDVTAPSTPGTPVATNNDGDGVTLTWTGSTDNVAVTGYRIEQVTPTQTTITTVAGLTYDVTGLDDAASYSYRVYGRDAAGNETASGTRVVVTPDITAPTQPGTITPSAPTSGTVTLSWSASSDNVAVTGYRVYAGPDTSGTLLHSPTGTSQTISGLSPNTSYTFAVVARDAAGLVSAARTITTSTGDSVAPATPANLRTTSRTGASISLAWDAASDDVATTGYRVFQDVAGTYTLVATTAGLATTISSLADATDYAFKVEAFDAATNTSARSAALATSTADTQAPSQPGTLVVGTVTGSSIAFTWSASTDARSPVTYELHDGSAVGPLLASTTSLDATATGLIDGVTYHVFLVARDPSGNVSASRDAFVATLDTTSPTAPTALAATNITGSAFDLTWTAATDNVGVDHYRVLVDGVEIATPTGLAASVTGRLDATTFDVDVIALDATGRQSPAASIDVTTLDTTAPSQPDDFVAGSASDSSIGLSWTGSTDNVAVAGYEIYQTSPGTPMLVASAAAGASSAIISGLALSTSYTFEIVARDGAGNESSRASVTRSTLAEPDSLPPTVPTFLLPTNVTTGGMRLAWTASSDVGGIAGYDLERLVGGTWTLVTPRTPLLLFDLTGLAPGTSHTFRVRVYDAAGNMSESAQIVVATNAGPDTTAPTTPLGPVTSTATDGGVVNLAWGASSDDRGTVTGYRVSRLTPAGYILQTIASTSAVTLTGQPIGTNATYAIAAVDLAGNASTALITTLTIPAPIPPPTPPPADPSPATGLAATVTSKTITLSWQAGAATSWRIVERRGGALTSTRDVSTTNASYGPYAPRTSVQFELYAIVGGVVSAPVAITVVTAADTVKPTKPGRFKAVSPAKGALALSWSRSTDDVSLRGYEVKLTTKGARPKVVKLRASALTTKVVRLKAKAAYTVQVRALDTAGNASAWATVKVRTK